jgi:hypothetical protein
MGFPRNRGLSTTLRGVERLMPDLVHGGGRRHGGPGFGGRGRFYDWSYERSQSGHRRDYLRHAAPPLDGGAEAPDRGREHGTGRVRGHGGPQARHQPRAVLRVAATAGAGRRNRRRGRHPAALGVRRCDDDRSVPGSRSSSCTAGVRRNAGRAGSAGRRHCAARWCGGTGGRRIRR